MDTYTKGFIAKCAQWNVDPVKLAQILSLRPISPGTPISMQQNEPRPGKYPMGNYAKILAQAMRKK